MHGANNGAHAKTACQIELELEDSVCSIENERYSISQFSPQIRLDSLANLFKSLISEDRTYHARGGST